MNQGLYSGVAATRAAERRLEAVTSNLANVGTPAYKGQATATRAFSLGKDTQVATVFTTRHEQGDLRRTGDPLHLALDGPGYFLVEGPEGELATRRGDFRLDAAGVLVDNEGLPVAFEGRAARIDPGGPTITIDGSGTVRQGEGEVGRLRLVDFADPDALERLGGGLLRLRPETPPQPATAVVHQGTLEQSNVSAVNQLVELVQVQRSFESASRLMGLIDQSYRSLIERR